MLRRMKCAAVVHSSKTSQCVSQFVDDTTATSDVARNGLLVVALAAILVVVVCVPRQTLLIERNDDLRTANVGETCRNEVGFVRIFLQTSMTIGTKHC